MIDILKIASERALIIAPHTDDELTCAGTILRLKDAGIHVRYVALSRCDESVPEGFPKDVLETECNNCLNKLGIESADVEVWKYPVRRFSEHRQDILEQFVKLAREFKPDLVLLPTSFDNHQDHRVTYEEGFRAFKFSSIFGYEMPQNMTTFNNLAFVVLSPSQLDNKINALAEYKSQEFRTYTNQSFLRSLAHVRGVQAGSDFAEAYEVIRLIIR